MPFPTTGSKNKLHADNCARHSLLAACPGPSHAAVIRPPERSFQPASAASRKRQGKQVRAVSISSGAPAEVAGAMAGPSTGAAPHANDTHNCFSPAGCYPTRADARAAAHGNALFKRVAEAALSLPKRCADMRKRRSSGGHALFPEPFWLLRRLAFKTQTHPRSSPYPQKGIRPRLFKRCLPALKTTSPP